jgi:hypothetical protein
VTDPLLPGEHYVWVERPSAPPFGRLVTLATPIVLPVPDEAAVPPADAELARRAARLGSGPLLVVTLRRDGGVAVVELRSVGPRGSTLRGMVRLGQSPASGARDLEASVTRALRAMRGELLKQSGGAPARARPPRERWYKNRWLWLGVGVVAGAAAVSPFIFSSDSGASPTDAAVDTGPLK